jgi:hypothetical protein
MGGSNFDLLMQEILKHKRIMEQLEEENRELRRQIADLREARGIYVEICGKRLPLAAELTTAPGRAIPTPAPVSYNTPTSKVSAPVTPTPQNAPILYTAEPDVTEAPTIAMPQTPSAVTETIEDEEEESYMPTFLEEIMIDEFASASTATTSPMAVWSPPAKKQQNTDEDARAALRRQLIGSFLLE